MSVCARPAVASAIPRRRPVIVRALTRTDASTMHTLTIRNARIALDALPAYFSGIIERSSPTWTAAINDQSTDGNRRVSRTMEPIAPSARERARSHFIAPWRSASMMSSASRNAASGSAYFSAASSPAQVHCFVILFQFSDYLPGFGDRTRLYA